MSLPESVVSLFSAKTFSIRSLQSWLPTCSRAPTVEQFFANSRTPAGNRLYCDRLRGCNMIHHIPCLEFQVCVKHLLGPILSRLLHFDVKPILKHTKGDLKSRPSNRTNWPVQK